MYQQKELSMSLKKFLKVRMFIKFLKNTMTLYL